MSLIKREAPPPTKRATTPATARTPLPLLGGDPLHVRLRPATLGDVVGHTAIVKALGNLLSGKNVPHSFLFTGPSGVGKTTLARIVGTLIGVAKDGRVEIDAARYSGVDNIRSIITGSQFSSLSETGRKLIIIDEAHRLSKGAWDSLLLSVEEPPLHVWWAFCSTEPDKIPKTIQTRCHAFDLKPLKWDELAEYLEEVVQQERLSIPAGMAEIIARRSNGSARQALVYLSSITGVTNKNEALRLIESVDSEEGTPIQLARMVCTGRGFSWPAACALVQSMSDESPETLRLVIVNYATSMIMGAKTMSEAEAQRLLAVLQAFAGPYNSSERQAPLLLALGTLAF